MTTGIKSLLTASPDKCNRIDSDIKTRSELTCSDKEKFRLACETVIGNEKQKNGIGTLGEKTLHAVLKNYYEPHKENQEIKIGGYVADIVGEKGVIEIQTRNFNRLLKKLESFLEFCDVTVVYPMPAVKYLRWLDTETGEITGRRKSPHKASIYECFGELYKIKYTLDNPRFHLRLCMLEVEEIRYLNGWSEDKKRGSSRCDRIPLNILDEIVLESPEDYRIFIPENLPGQFTSLDYSRVCKIYRKTAQSGLNLLSYLGIVEKVGTKGKNIVYKQKL